MNRKKVTTTLVVLAAAGTVAAAIVWAGKQVSTALAIVDPEGPDPATDWDDDRYDD